MSELAQIAWDSYSQAVGGKAFNGDSLPTWEEMVADPEKQKLVEAWRACACAMRRTFENWNPVEQGKPLPADVLCAVLRDGEKREIMWKIWPEWPPISGWKEWIALPI